MDIGLLGFENLDTEKIHVEVPALVSDVNKH